MSSCWRSGQTDIYGGRRIVKCLSPIRHHSAQRHFPSAIRKNGCGVLHRRKDGRVAVLNQKNPSWHCESLPFERPLTPYIILSPLGSLSSDQAHSDLMP